MYACLHTGHMSICLYVYIDIYMYVYIHMDIYLHIQMYISILVHTNIGTQLADTILSIFHMLTWFNSHNLPKRKTMKDSTPTCFRIVC